MQYLASFFTGSAEEEKAGGKSLSEEQLKFIQHLKTC